MFARKIISRDIQIHILSYINLDNLNNDHVVLTKIKQEIDPYFICLIWSKKYSIYLYNYIKS
jgi:hypothetical protein